MVEIVCTRWNSVLAALSRKGELWPGEQHRKKQTFLFFPNYLLPQNSSFWLLSHGHTIFQRAFCLVLSTYDEGMGRWDSLSSSQKLLLDFLCCISHCLGPHWKVEHQGIIPLPIYFPILRSHTSGKRTEFIQLISDSFSNSSFMASRVICSVASSSALLNWRRQEKEWVSNAYHPAS